MEDHDPTSILLDEDAGSEIWSAAGLAVLGLPRRLLDAIYPGHRALHFDVGFRHGNIQLIQRGQHVW